MRGLYVDMMKKEDTKFKSKYSVVKSTRITHEQMSWMVERLTYYLFAETNTLACRMLKPIHGKGAGGMSSVTTIIFYSAPIYPHIIIKYR